MTIPSWIEHSEASLLIMGGLIHYHLDRQEEAITSFTLLDNVLAAKPAVCRFSKIQDEPLDTLLREWGFVGDEGISQLRNPPTHGVSELGNALSVCKATDYYTFKKFMQ